MSDSQISRLEHKRELLRDELHHLPDLMRGKVYERQRKCGRAACPCASGGPRQSDLQLSVNLGGRTRSRYVRQGERAVVEAKLSAYRRLWALVGENLELSTPN
jgi:hypothetical protein